MGSDRARISYDERQHYRSVVMQQGRVTLEADWNEAQAISSAETRKEALDFVGPAGTPDDGYAVTFPSSSGFDFQVGVGTMYVGGLRSELTSPVQYSQQSEWLDNNAPDPDWVSLPQQSPGNEYVYLFLREQEISAVEDSDLKDVALGGPDTAQRTRLIQHIVRLSTTGNDCPSALVTAQTKWTQEGLAFDSASMRLNSQATLQVSFTPTGPPPTPCDPTAQGGYLGADNQLIRVQISSAGAGANSSPALLWGYDDASFLYRVDVIDPHNLKFESAPVDNEHQPQAGQAVEILMAAAQLANGEYIASPTGFVTTIATAYNRDTQTVSLQDALPQVYGDGNPQHPHPARVFLRVWQQQLSFTPGTAVELDSTGVQVTLQTSNNAPLHVGDYWMFAVRPSTPQQIYPERYLSAAQPPEGPREWVCPLAVIQWSTATGGGQVIANCRNSFDNLVDLARKKLGGCCTVNISPADLSANNTLQAIVDQFRGATGVNVCFAPGTYNLTQPLLLTAEHSNFNFEGCAGGVTFQVAQGSENNFMQGMVVVHNASAVSFRAIRFQLPLVAYGATTVAVGIQQAAQVFFSLGLRPIMCTDLTVEDCQFEFTPAQDAAQVAVGILAGGDSVGFRLERNLFEMPASSSSSPLTAPGGPTTFTAGYVLFPSTVSKSISPIAAVQAGAAGQLLPSYFHDAIVRENLFTGLTVPIFVYSDCGLAEFEANTVRNCSNGFWLVSLPFLAELSNLNNVTVGINFTAAAADLQKALVTTLSHPAVQLATATLRGFPLPDSFDLTQALPVTLPKVGTAIRAPSLLQQVFNRVAAAAVTAADVAAAPVKGRAAKPVPIGSLSSIVVSHPVTSAVFDNFDMSILNNSYSQFEIQALQKPIARAVPVGLHFEDNDINNQITGVPTGASLLILSLATDDRDTISVTGNTLVGATGTGPVSLLFGVSRCMHTGNMVLNEAATTTSPAGAASPIASLWLFPRSVTSSLDGTSVVASAITGNVFRGVPILPPRNVTPAPPAPMDTWHFFNSET